jgi:hypothetical protein
LYIYSLPIAGAALLAASLAFALKGGRKKAKEGKNSARRRLGRGLVLMRENQAPKGRSGLAAPLLMGLVILGLGSWLAAAYFLPEERAALAEGESAGEPASPPPARTLSGKIVPPAAEAQSAPAAQNPAVMAQAAAAAAASPPPAGGSLNAAERPAAPAAPISEAAQAMALKASRLEQVGLLPAKNGPAPPQKAKPARPANATPAAANAIPARPANATPATPANATPAPPANATPAAPANATPAAANAAPAKPPAGTGLLAATREFTVHLASFGDPGNADKYKTKLVDAGENAFISEITVEGRIWYRVMSGRFNNQNEANNHGLDLRRRGLTTDSGNFLVKPLR